MLPGSFSVPLSDLPVTTTEAPSRARRSTMTRPIPRLDPVTTATRPSSRRWALIGAHHRPRDEGSNTVEADGSDDARGDLPDGAGQLVGQRTRQAALEDLQHARVIPELRIRIRHGEPLPHDVALGAQVSED